MPIALTVNGGRHETTAEADTPLLYVLRNDLGLNGPRFGCGTGQCGACTVLVEGVPLRACQLELGALGGRAVTTLEGLGTPAQPHKLQRAFIAEQAAQCGYCANGMVINAAALLGHNPKPNLDEVQQALANNLCRCGTHDRILRAVMRASGQVMP